MNANINVIKCDYKKLTSVKIFRRNENNCLWGRELIGENFEKYVTNKRLINLFKDYLSFKVFKIN